MKRTVITMLLVCVVAFLICLVAPEGQAAEHSHHCYCSGNGGSDHVCETSAEWIPVNSGTTIAVQDGGHYYLEKNMAASITVKNGQTVTLCLNGCILRAQCPVIVSNGVLNICDCRGGGYIRTTVPQNSKGTTVLISGSQSGVGVVNLYSGAVDGIANNGVFCRSVEVCGGRFNFYGGTVRNGLSDGSVSTDSRPGYGGNILVQNSGDIIGKFTMYGGTVTGGEASLCGGNVFAAKDASASILGGVLENGTADYGGNLYYQGNLVMKNATVRGGNARIQRGNLLVAKGIDLTVNTITQGVAAGKPENIRILRNKTTLSTDHTSIAEAVEKMKKDNAPSQLQLQLLGDHSEDYTAAYSLTLDLNGYALSGLRVSGTLYGMDSATDSYTGTTAGRFSYTLQGGQVLAADSYLQLNDADGDSFHRYAMQITHINLVPSRVAMGYKARVYGDEAVLAQIDRVGYQLWLEGDSPQTYSKAFDNRVVTLRLQQILTASASREENLANAQKKINARPFLVFNDGTRITFNTVGYSFREAIDKTDNNYEAYNDAQKQGLQTLAETYGDVMLGWDVENLHHATGWQSLTQSRLSDWIGLYSNSSNANQKLLLTEDLDFGSSTFTVKAGSSLTLCLNGHNIVGSKQLFACHGDLTICDCHEDGHEGTVNSSFASTTNEYAPVAHLWTGSMTLYGGKLTAGGNVRSAGVVAVGNPYREAEAANFYMYGGSISGGYARFNGGLMNVWHGSAFHMYGGKLHDGYCESNGGGIVARDGSTVNLYGGEIYNCTAAGNGGGVWVALNANCYLGNVKIYNNTGENGGNMYSSESTLTVNGATVTGGTAQMGGGIYVHSGTARVTGITRILDNTAHSVGADLHIYYNGSVCADGLTQGADVRISAARHGKVGTDPAIAQYLHCNTEGYTVMKNGADMVIWNGPLVESYTQEGFTAGYGAVCINPKEMGLPLSGYGDATNRKSERIDGDLYVTATAITDENGQTVLMLAVDMSTMSKTQLEPILDHVSYYTGVPRSHIISTTSHTHSSPSLGESDPTITRYRQLLPDWFAQAAIQALNDRAPATMYTGSFEVGGGKNGYGLNFTRHYKFLRDGLWEYSCDNFGERSLNDKEQVQHVTDADPTMHLVKFDREGTDILMVNWRAHPTMTGGTTKFVMSSDYVGALRDAVKADTGMDVIFFQGAAGNVNTVSRLTKEAHGLNFRAYAQSLSDQIQTAITDGCLTPKETGLWQVDNYQYTALVDRSDNDRYEEAKAFVAEYYETFPGNQAPQQERLDWCAERGWTCVFEASSIIRRYEKTNDTELVPLNTLALGKHLAFYTAPGELWDTVSQEVEAAGYFDTVFCIGYSMASYSYFVYDPTNGGAMQYESYEGFNRNFVAPTTINDMLDYWKSTLEEMAQNAE